MDKRVMIFGTFDVLHPGHEFVINEALKRGTVTVIVARDKNVEKIKKRMPQQNERERAVAIHRKFPMTTVELGDPEDFLAPIKRMQPDLILLGYDQKLPPGVSEKDLPCGVERLPGHKPEEFKSSKLRKQE